MTDTHSELCREEFEKWALANGYSQSGHPAADRAWQAWQAAWNTRPERVTEHLVSSETASFQNQADALVLKSSEMRTKEQPVGYTDDDPRLVEWYAKKKQSGYPKPPEGMVELRFLSLGGQEEKRLRYENGKICQYSYAPVDYFFMEVRIGQDQYRLDFGKCTGPTGVDFYGIHIFHPFDVKAQQHSVNACDITRPYLSRPEREYVDAARYRWLRERDLDAIGMGGVFAGMTPDNVVLNEEDLDEAIDRAMSLENARRGSEVGQDG